MLLIVVFFVRCMRIMFFFFSSRRRHTRLTCDWSSDVCSSDLDPARQPIPAAAIRSEFGFPGVITSAYIAWRTPELRERALAGGIHELLGFDGPVMTDSGAFQQHAYGSVEADPNEIIEFQSRI